MRFNIIYQLPVALRYRWFYTYIIMRNVYVAGLVLFGLIWMAGIFLGYLHSLKKALNQPQIETTESQRLRSDQRKIAEETELKRKQLMESLQQRIRDGQKNH